MRKILIILVLIEIGTIHVFSQKSNTFFKLEMQSGYNGKQVVPFWFSSNNYGSVPIKGIYSGIIGSASRNYDTTKNHIFDWGTTLESRVNLGKGSNIILVEGEAKARLWIFQLKAGRSKDIMGLCDKDLRSGSWSISGNALGIPKIEGSIPEYYSIPWFGKMFAFKGQIAHGWIGPVLMRRPENIMLKPDTIKNITYFHQKSFYGRFGKPNWKFKIYGGFNHQVFWGNENILYGDIFSLNKKETLYHVFIGKKYGNSYIPTSKIGNHLGSIDIGGEFTIRNIKTFIYRQNFYDVGNLYYLTNIRDGLHGISIENLKPRKNTFKFNKLLFEFLYTKSQGGQPEAKWTPTPYEQYYNNFQYIHGWTYKNIPLGFPFLTTRDNLHESLPMHQNTYFANNRVILYHMGLTGSIYNWCLKLKASYSLNFGTYYTTDEPQSTGINNPGEIGLFGKQKQFSFFMDCDRPINSNYNAGFMIGFDKGTLLENTFGLIFKISRSFE